MPYQTYYYQDPGTYQKSRLNSAISRWKPGDWGTFTSGIEESFTQYTALGWLAKEAHKRDLSIALKYWTVLHTISSIECASVYS